MKDPIMQIKQLDAVRIENSFLWRRTQEELTFDLKKTIFLMLQGKYKKPARRLILDNINLTIYKGEKLGIVGANGAGKSTLLKLICGILQPTIGKVRVNGRIAPLIELGAGFNPENTVIQNIIIYGMLLGFSKTQIKQRIPDILEFAELQDYAQIPVKALSSGMRARLGFAIATEVNPDILILDEVLSVGDARFKIKSKKRMQQFWEKKITIIVVSHSLDFIKESCDRTIWLNQGRIIEAGNSVEVVDHYLEFAQTD